MPELSIQRRSMALALSYERNQIKVHLPVSLRPRQQCGVSRSIARPRLLRIMSQDQQPLLLITAPAGYGKTTLVADWIADGDRAHRWISLTSQHNDPINFWGTIISAVDALIPGSGRRACDLLHASQQPSMSAILVILVEDLKSMMEEKGSVPTPVVVLDNYHMIDSRTIHQRLGQLIEALQSRIRFAVISRQTVPFFQDSRQLTKRSCVLDANDLAFTSDEIAQLYRQNQGIACSPVLLATIVNRTEGWAHAVHCAQSILATDSDPGRFATRLRGDKSPMHEYLFDNVYSLLPQTIQIFLMFASVLERLVPEQLSTLFNEEATALLFDVTPHEKQMSGVGHRSMIEEQFTGASEILAYLEANHIFVSRLDEYAESYRLHPLFAEMLRALLRQQDPQVEVMLRGRMQSGLLRRECEVTP